MQYAHRFQDAPVEYRIPQPPEPPASATGFLLFPLAGLPGALPQSFVHQLLYQWALEQARACARPSLPERDLLGYWN